MKESNFLFSCSLAGWILLACVAGLPAQAQEVLKSQPQQDLLGVGRPVLSGPLSLASAVRLAEQKSLEVQISEQDLASAEAEVRTARSARLPLITLGGAYTLANDNFFYTLSQGPGNIPRSSTGELNLGVSLPLYTGGKLEAREDQAVTVHEAAHFDLAATRRTSVLAARQAYYQAVLAQAQVGVYRDYVAQREAALSNTRERLTVGKVTRIYVLRDETELATAKQTLITAQTLLNSALADLKRTLGVSPTSDFTLNDRLVIQQLEIDLPQILAVVKQKNPELQALRLRIKAADTEVRIANAAFLPQVNLYGQGELRTPQTDGFGNGGSLVVAATLPILDFGGRRAEVDKAMANLRKAQLQSEAKEQELAQTVTHTWLELQKADSTIQLTRKAVEQATEENRLSKERFAVGRSIQVELLDSSVALLKAQLENLKAMYDYNVARAQLEQATNGQVS